MSDPLAIRCSSSSHNVANKIFSVSSLNCSWTCIRKLRIWNSICMTTFRPNTSWNGVIGYSRYKLSDKAIVCCVTWCPSSSGFHWQFFGEWFRVSYLLTLLTRSHAGNMTYCIYGLLLILGIETTHLGVLGIARTMRPNYPHLIISSLCRDSVLWWVNSCSERANTKYDLVYDVDQGSNPSPSLRLGVDRWIGTFLSLSPFYLSIFSPIICLHQT